jgi:hypothetical protein
MRGSYPWRLRGAGRRRGHGVVADERGGIFLFEPLLFIIWDGVADGRSCVLS